MTPVNQLISQNTALGWMPSMLTSAVCINMGSGASESQLSLKSYLFKF